MTIRIGKIKKQPETLKIKEHWQRNSTSKI